MMIEEGAGAPVAPPASRAAWLLASLAPLLSLFAVRPWIRGAFPVWDYADMLPLLRASHGFGGAFTALANWSRLDGRVSWPDIIRDGLDEDRFVLQAQPIMNLATGDTGQFELLLCSFILTEPVVDIGKQQQGLRVRRISGGRGEQLVKRLLDVAFLDRRAAAISLHDRLLRIDCNRCVEFAPGVLQAVLLEQRHCPVGTDHRIIRICRHAFSEYRFGRGARTTFRLDEAQDVPCEAVARRDLRRMACICRRAIQV